MCGVCTSTKTARRAHTKAGRPPLVLAMTVPEISIDPAAFHADPYPILAQIQEMSPVTYVRHLDAYLITRRDDVAEWERKTHILSSDQPGGLMTVLMGQNMMRKDGAAHQTERRAIFPTISPKTVRDHWAVQFQRATRSVLHRIAPLGKCDLVADYAMPVSAKALKLITGLTQMPWQHMDAVSQAMIDGCANYADDPDVTARCHTATRDIDHHITNTKNPDPLSLLAVQQAAGLGPKQISANIKLAISGGQNEPRDAIAGAAFAVLQHPETRSALDAGVLDWSQIFEEYCRWMAPIGMSPRRITQKTVIHGLTLPKDARAFLMFGAANRDPRVFKDPATFDPWRDCRRAVTFGAGPHFCAGAAISRELIAKIALPMLFEHLPRLRLNGPTKFQGWAFRGPDRVNVTWA